MSSLEATTRRFRDIFLSCLETSSSDRERDSSLTRQQQNLLLHLPTPALAPDAQAETAEGLLQAIDEVYQKVSPEELHRHGLSVPIETVDPGRITRALRHQRLTIVVFPGIFSEFIEAGSFDAIFDNPKSTCRKQWLETLSEYERGHTEVEIQETLFDEQFSLDLLDSDAHESPYERREMSHLVEVASIDDDAQQPLVRVVRFGHRLMSLETFGDIERIAEILTRRLHKFFELMGVPDNIALLGYSMGTPVALDVLAKAFLKNESWTTHVRAVVSVGGVVYGSHAADDAIYPPEGRRSNSSYRQVEALRVLERTLRQTKGLRFFKRKPLGHSKLSTLITNTRAWLRFGVAWADSIKEMVDSGAQIPIPKLIRIGRKVDVKPVLGLATRVGIGTFNLFNPFRYSSNIRKFRRLLRAAIAGIESLTTQARVRWWKENTLPTEGVWYYAVAGTMSDAPPDSKNRELSDNTRATNPMSLDYQILLNGYRGIVESSGQLLNDGQMAAVRTQFWPDLARMHNSNYDSRPLRGVLLGVMATHHWGLTLPEVNAMHSGPNPFPRSALLKAIAAQIAFDLESRAEQG